MELLKSGESLRVAALVALIFFLLAGQVSALTMEIDKSTYAKGEEMRIVGSEAVGFVDIAAKNEDREVFSVRQLPSDGNYVLTRKIDFTDPKGVWKISVKDAKSEQQKDVIVNPNRESEYLVVSFLSPAASTYTRTATIEVTVEIKDSGKPVTDAIAYFWGIKGEKLGLQPKGDGKYSLTYELPVDARLGEFNLRAAASSFSGEQRIGGETSLGLKIDQTPVLIELVEPKVEEIELGQETGMNVRLTYANGKPVENAELAALLHSLNVGLDGKGNGSYDGKFKFEETEAEVIELKIKANDAYGNRGEFKKQLKTSGTLSFALKENFVLYLFPVIFLFYIFFISANEASYFLRRSLYRRNKQKLLLTKRELQRQYYQERQLDEQSFNSRNAEIDAQLNEIRTKLEALEQNYRPTKQTTQAAEQTGV